MTEHPIVPISTVRKFPAKKEYHDHLVLNIKASDIELNFYKGVNYKLVDSIVEKLVDHD